MRKRPKVVKLICEDSCPFFKSVKKEEEACQGFIFFNEYLNQERITEVYSVLQKEISAWRLVDGNFMYHILCRKCPFLVGGCDFCDPEYREETFPCGGYMVLAELWENRVSWLKEIVSQLTGKKENARKGYLR
jgi:hypothetical protein